MKDKDLFEEIKGEICIATASLGGKADILAIIGSWGDTLVDKEILSLLKSYNKKYKSKNKHKVKFTIHTK